MPLKRYKIITEMRKIVLATFGSLGDLHPYLAIARVLKNHGDQVTVVTHPHYREVVERAGFSFISMRPGPEDVGPEELWTKKANDSSRGTEFVVRELVLPYLSDNFRVLMEATEGCDLIIAHLLTFAAPVVAQKRGIPWISCVLQPSVFFSAYDPPSLGPLSFLSGRKLFGPSISRFILNWITGATRNWLSPVNSLRTEVGLPAISENQLIRYFSPHRTLALFPKPFASPQPDWPENVRQVGFPFFGKEEKHRLSEPLLKFITNGPAPFVFTLGSAIVQMETDFFKIAFEAVKNRGIRAVFLTGKEAKNLPEEVRLNLQVFVSEYEPFPALFPLCKAIVHQCGIGTTSQALSAGKPQILIPFAHDQPDNANRVKKLGIGLVIPARRLNIQRLSAAIKEITEEEAYMHKAEIFSRLVITDSFSTRIVEALDKFAKIENSAPDPCS